MIIKSIIFLIWLLVNSTNTIPPRDYHYRIQINDSLINISGKTIEDRFHPPVNFNRTKVNHKSFEYFLRSLPLKDIGSQVRLYNGNVKRNTNIYISLVDLDIGDKDLQQCADAIIRLRAEYLYANRQYDSIHFNLTNGFRVNYFEWAKGKRVVVERNKCIWKDIYNPSTSYKTFRDYLDFIFMYAGTLSLSKELKPVSIQCIRIGDIFIQGGSPGHAVIVVDMAINFITGERLFILAQSYMPAQEIHILINPNNPEISPWYSSVFNGKLKTPEWEFNQSDLKRF